ncbi:MAG TPA: hypothetical protein VMO78_11360 [Rhizomicrobium sp.]|nr:hypothetical protein [Rhizomicrobium sp.]
MGGHPWWYLVPFEKDVQTSLDALRQREFKAGRYNPAEPFPNFPVDPNHAPGCKHASIDEAREDSDADGTRSILDVSRLSAKPDYDAVAPLDDDELMEFFGTTKPTADEVEDNDGLFDQIERGQGIYVIVYENDQPAQIFFAGYSYD